MDKIRTFKKRKVAVLEIERKWLVKKLPKNLLSYPHKELIAGYFQNKAGEDIRIRQEDDLYYKVQKTGRGVARDIGRGDILISRDEFYQLWPKTINRRLWKTRYLLPYGLYTIELDIYRDFPELFTAEVEFKSIDEADKFIPPKWFGRDATEDKTYSSNYLATNGLAGTKNFVRLELDAGIERIIGLAENMKSKGSKTIIIQIAGGSASGKTSAVAEKIKNYYGKNASILSMDDYYHGVVFMHQEKAKGRHINWDQPEAQNLDLLKQHLSILKTSQFIDKPIYSFKSGEPIGVVVFKSTKVIILEGLFALNDELISQGDIRVFVDIGLHGRIIRRLLRDVERTGKKPADILRYFSEIVEPMHEKYVQHTIGNADVVLSNEYRPSVEAKKSGLYEIQIKFTAKIDSDRLIKIGANRLSKLSQLDYYYNPKDRNLADTGEALRIREEGTSWSFTYKGPKSKSEYRKRPKLEFEIDKDLKEKFLALYGNQIKMIKKNCELFELDGIVLSLDSVRAFDINGERELGKFLEIRSNSKLKNEKKIKKVLKKLNLKIRDGIMKSYVEM